MYVEAGENCFATFNFCDKSKFIGQLDELVLTANAYCALSNGVPAPTEDETHDHGAEEVQRGTGMLEGSARSSSLAVRHPRPP